MPKLIPHEVILVSSIPACNFCEDGTPGPYDFATIMGPWANGCETHWKLYRASPNLGTGSGQLWITEDQAEPEARPTKKAQLQALMVEIETGLVDDETANKRLDEIGATEDDLMNLMGF